MAMIKNVDIFKLGFSRQGCDPRIILGHLSLGQPSYSQTLPYRIHHYAFALSRNRIEKAAATSQLFPAATTLRRFPRHLAAFKVFSLTRCTH